MNLVDLIKDAFAKKEPVAIFEPSVAEDAGENPLDPATIMAQCEALLKAHQKPFIIPADVARLPQDSPFMQYSTCTAQDFYHPEFKRLADIIALDVFMHRKLWEYIFIQHHAFRLDAVGEGRRAIGFGVGTEPLPSAFAQHGTQVIATDIPFTADHQAMSQDAYLAHAMINLPSIHLDREQFGDKVTFDICDMNAIGEDIKDFDFCWSSGSLQQLGSIRKGREFIINSVEKVLKPGGVAIHTTEFNLSSNEDTEDRSDVVLFRRRDIDSLIKYLKRRGHEVEPFIVCNNVSPADNYIDTEPYCHDLHLKLRLKGHVTTSCGLVIRRGK